MWCDVVQQGLCGDSEECITLIRALQKAGQSAINPISSMAIA